MSVVIPTHARRELLQELLTALAEQQMPAGEFEAVVVVDGSTDGTWEMLQSLEVPYALNATYQHQLGPSRARNHGARLARGEAVVFVDDDMLPLPDLLAEHWRVHADDPDAVVLGLFMPAGNSYTKGKGGWNIWEERVLRNHYAAVASGKRPPAGRRLYSGNFSVRRDHFLRVGGFDESLQRQEDVDLGLRLERAGLRYYYRPEAATIHRGYRPFDSWRRSAYAQGKYDVLFATEKGYDVLPEVMGWYYHLPAAARVVVGLTIFRPWLRDTGIWALRAGGAALTRLRLYALAHPCYSGIYKIGFWQGAADALGGQRAFREHTAAFRQGHLRAHAPERS